MRRTIQRRVDNELASMVLSGSLDPGDRVVVGADGEAGGPTFDVVAGRPRRKLRARESERLSSGPQPGGRKQCTATQIR